MVLHGAAKLPQEIHLESENKTIIRSLVNLRACAGFHERKIQVNLDFSPDEEV